MSVGLALALVPSFWSPVLLLLAAAMYIAAWKLGRSVWLAGFAFVLPLGSVMIVGDHLADAPLAGHGDAVAAAILLSFPVSWTSAAVLMGGQQKMINTFTKLDPATRMLLLRES